MRWPPQKKEKVSHISHFEERERKRVHTHTHTHTHLSMYLSIHPSIYLQVSFLNSHLIGNLNAFDVKTATFNRMNLKLNVITNLGHKQLMVSDRSSAHDMTNWTNCCHF